MKWTTEQPTEPGWYWMALTKRGAGGVMSLVTFDRDQVATVRFPDRNMVMPMNAYPVPSRYWKGPLKP